MIAIIPALDYDTYDIYIHVRQNPNFMDRTQEIEFEFTLVDREYTTYFIVIWTVLCAVSALIYLTYLVFLCRRNEFNCFTRWCQIRAKNKFWFFMGFGLIWFNNPFHILVVYTPTLFGQIFEMLWMTTYLVLILAYLENNFYMMRAEMYHRCKCLKWFKFLYYSALMSLIAVLNGLSITKVKD